MDEDEEILRRNNMKRRINRGGVLFEEDEIEVSRDTPESGEGRDLLAGEEGEVWYSQPILDAYHVFTLNFFAAAAFVFAILSSLATILAVVFPFVSDHSDQPALVIANYIACGEYAVLEATLSNALCMVGFLFWWYLALYSFIFILFAMSALIIRYVKTSTLPHTFLALF